MQLTLSDFEGTPEEPTWLVAEGVLRLFEKARGSVAPLPLW
jgi:hypothetical protein